MQFGKVQREQLHFSWGPQSWFFQNLGPTARDIVGRAYGLTPTTAIRVSSSQEYLSLALTIFAQKIGADKSHVVHALLTGNEEALKKAILDNRGVYVINSDLADAWQAAFREVQSV